MFCHVSPGVLTPHPTTHGAVTHWSAQFLISYIHGGQAKKLEILLLKVCLPLESVMCFSFSLPCLCFGPVFLYSLVGMEQSSIEHFSATRSFQHRNLRSSVGNQYNIQYCTSPKFLANNTCLCFSCKVKALVKEGFGHHLYTCLTQAHISCPWYGMLPCLLRKQHYFRQDLRTVEVNSIDTLNPLSPERAP